MIGLSTSVPKKEWNKQETTAYGWKQKYWLLPRMGRSLNMKLFPFPFFDFDPTILGWMRNNNLKIKILHRGALLFWIRGGGHMDTFLGDGSIRGMRRTIGGRDHGMRGLIQFCIATLIFRARGFRIHNWRWRTRSPSFGLGLGEVILLLFCWERWAGVLQMPWLVAMAATKCSIFIIQCLGPKKVIYLEIDLVWKSFS